MRSPRFIRYRGHRYVKADVPLDMDSTVKKVKEQLRGSQYAKEHLDHSSTQRFEDDLDVASTILAKSIFHDVVFEEPGNSFAKFYSWLADHHPANLTSVAIRGVVKRLKQSEPELFRSIVQQVRKEVLL